MHPLNVSTWLQALSRAFGDAYLKSSAQFEGVPAGSDGYSSGFGLTSEPHIVVEDIQGARLCSSLLVDKSFAEQCQMIWHEFSSSHAVYSTCLTSYRIRRKLALPFQHSFSSS